MAPFVCTPLDRSRETRPATALAPTLPRPPQPAPRRDDGRRPSERDRMAGVVRVIWGNREAEYFCRDGWTAQIALIGLTKSAFSRNAFWRDLRGLSQGRLANWRRVTRVTANRCAAGHRGTHDRPRRGPPGDAAMNAIAVPKSSAQNRLEGFALTAISHVGRSEAADTGSLRRCALRNICFSGASCRVECSCP